MEENLALIIDSTLIHKFQPDLLIQETQKKKQIPQKPSIVPLFNRDH